MVEFNKAKLDYIRTQQTTITSSNPSYFNIPDLENQILEDKGYTSWREYFYAYGYTDAHEVHLTQLWWRWLVEKGFSQKSLRGKFKAFYEDGTVNL